MNESLTYPQTLALTDRLDYLSAHQSRHALCMCIEKAAGIEITERAQYIRTIMDELQRIDSHLLYYSCLVLDMGGMTPFFYGSASARWCSIYSRKLPADASYRTII